MKIFKICCTFGNEKFLPMADFTTVAISLTSGENSHFPASKKMLKVQFLLDMLGKITCFTHVEQAIVNLCDIFFYHRNYLTWMRQGNGFL